MVATLFSTVSMFLIVSSQPFFPALAVMFEQAQVPKEMAYCDADPDKHVYPIFNLQRGRLGLPTYMAGVGLRAWREHRHAAFVGMVAQSCASAQLQFGGVTR